MCSLGTVYVPPSGTACCDAVVVDGVVAVPYGAKGVIAEVHRDATVIAEADDDVGATFRVQATPEVLARLQSLAARSE
jgi:hypothetical protein